MLLAQKREQERKREGQDQEAQVIEPLVAPEAPEAPTPEAPEAPEIDINAPAPNDEPEILYADKFKSVSDLENSYKELQSTFSKKMGVFQGAPDEKIGYGKRDDLSDEEAFFAQGLAKWGAENQLSDDGYNVVVDNYRNSRSAIEESRQNQTRKDLGENAEMRLRNISDFLSSKLDENQFKALSQGINSVDQVQALERLIETQKAPQPVEVQSQAMSQDKLHQMRFAKDDNGHRKMEDPAYRARVMKLEAEQKR